MNFDFSNFFSTLVGAGVGAWSAYHFNLMLTEKQQKDTEKFLLIQLFYDLNILSKYLYRYSTNAVRLIENISSGSVPYNTPLSMEPDTIDIQKLGFITLKSNKMYEILSHTRMEIITIFEQGIVYNEAVISKKKDSIMQLIAICMLFPKLLTKIYVCLLNINFILIKYYKTDNLIKDNVLNNMSEIKLIIENVKKQYNEVINSSDLICLYTGKPYTREQKDGEKEDLEYIEYILNEWILDFDLPKKLRQRIEDDIMKTFHKDITKLETSVEVSDKV